MNLSALLPPAQANSPSSMVISPSSNDKEQTPPPCNGLSHDNIRTYRKAVLSEKIKLPPQTLLGKKAMGDHLDMHFSQNGTWKVDHNQDYGSRSGASKVATDINESMKFGFLDNDKELVCKNVVKRDNRNLTALRLWMVPVVAPISVLFKFKVYMLVDCHHIAIAPHLTSTHDDEGRVKLITESCGIFHPLAHGKSLNLAVIKQVKEDQLSGLQVHTSSVLEPGLTTTNENMTFAQGIENDIVQLSTSLEVLAATIGTSLTTSTHPAEAMADHSNDDDRQTILSATQIMGCVVESPSAIVVGVAGAQLSKEFIHRDTSLMKVIQQQMKLGSKELTARTQEKYNIHKQATSSDNDKTAIQLTHTPQQNSTECEQQVVHAQMQGVSNVGQKSRSKSISKKYLHTENMETVKLSTTTTSEPSPRQTVKGVVGSLHLDIESHSMESIRSSHRLIDGSEAGTVASLINEIHWTVAKEDNVEFEEEQVLVSSVYTDKFMSAISPTVLLTIHSSLMVPIKGAVGGETSIGKPADHIAENNNSGGKFTMPTFSSLAQEEQMQSVLEVNRPSDALSRDDCQSMRQYIQCYRDNKSSTLDVTSDEFQQRSKEGASANMAYRNERMRLQATLSSERSTFQEYVCIGNLSQPTHSMLLSKSLVKVETHSFTKQLTKVVNMFHMETLDTMTASRKDSMEDGTGVHSHSFASIQEMVDNNLHTRCLSQFIFISVHISIICSVDDCMQTIVHLYMFNGALDESEWGHQIGDDGGVEYHGVQTNGDHDRKYNWVTVCTFFFEADYEVLITHILSCIDLDLGTPQHLGLLCAILRKAKEIVVTLNDTLYLIIDILEYHGLEVGNVSVNELNVGYWVQVMVFLCKQLKDQVLDVFVEDGEQYEQGVSAPLDAELHMSAEELV
ncbi:hypothetical protein HD554DRAFT_2274278 [Boletus coccyginus]|nr:hypothetical protein HD554DRAFT_2274278 [Boletus coccyginus]